MKNVYVALLRGVNVGGNSIISMTKLKESLVKAGFKNVSTYINSGNVLFTSEDKNVRKLEKKMEAILTKNHKINSRVIIRSLSDIASLVKQLPSSWNNKLWRYNVMFLSHKIDSKSLLKTFQPKPKIESVKYVPGALLWAAEFKNISKTQMMKINRMSIYKEMTVRNPNTTKKLHELMKKIK
jgi:uncharacterized protein (DUF1697 family)